MNASASTTGSVDGSFRLQAVAVVRRWVLRRGRVAVPPAVGVPARVDYPPAAAARDRTLRWIVHQQRLIGLLLAALLAAVGLVWTGAATLTPKPAIVLRAGPTLKQAAADFYGVPELSYDQLAFFLLGTVPLLYAAQNGNHPWLPLAEGVAAPDLCREAEHRLSLHAAEMAAHGISQSLALTSIAGVVADRAEGRAAAHLSGILTVTARGGEARNYPWEAQAVVAFNPASRLDPYPFYLLRLMPTSQPSIAAGFPAPAPQP